MPIPPATTLPLSVVATSRNDNHGGSLTERMQHFVDGFITQCKRHNLRAELIMVEWNPPEGRVSLRDELKWPEDLGPCEVRIVTFPKAMHDALPHSQHLPLYQMIAKNVGIVRARGKFVLATNIDILFSDEIMIYMRDHLETGHLYRVERHDIPSQLPIMADFGDLIGWCWKNTFRINANGLTFPVGQGIEAPTRFQLLSRAAVSGVKKIFTRTGQEILNLSHATRKHLRIIGGDLADLAATLVRPLGIRSETPAERSAFAAKSRASRLSYYLALPMRPLRYAFYLPVRMAQSMGRAWDRLMVYLDYRRLFTNACGDFTLLSRDDWFLVRGYPEWPIYSFHIDSLLLYQSDRAGIKEVHLGRDHSVFHIEHDAGSGFTPEYAHKLFERLEARGIPYLEWNTDVKRLIQEMDRMRKRHALITFNEPDWGYQSVALHDEYVGSRVAETALA